MNFQVITWKTMLDLFSIRRTIMFLVPVLLVTLIGSGIFAEGAKLSEMTLAMQNQMVIGFFLILSFIWIAGIPLVLLGSVTCGDFISKEDQDGTLLLLVSKPVRRYEIIIGKFFAFMIHSIILELAVLLLSVFVMASVLQLDIFIFSNILVLIPPLFLYSIFVSFIFGTLATAFSSLFKSRIKTIMSLVAITILIFFGFMIIRGWMGPIYSLFCLDYFDINYHLGNSFLLFVEMSGIRIMPIYQGILGQFTGTYDSADIVKLYDMDIGALPPELQANDLVTPIGSISIWIGLSLALLFAGITKFNKKEIN